MNFYSSYRKKEARWNIHAATNLLNTKTYKHDTLTYLYGISQYEVPNDIQMLPEKRTPKTPMILSFLSM
jgi:hypothetical protein